MPRLPRRRGNRRASISLPNGYWREAVNRVIELLRVFRRYDDADYLEEEMRATARPVGLSEDQKALWRIKNEPSALGESLPKIKGALARLLTEEYRDLAPHQKQELREAIKEAVRLVTGHRRVFRLDRMRFEKAKGKVARWLRNHPKALRSEPEPETMTAIQPHGFTTDWPLGMKADLAQRKVRRGDKMVEFGGHQTEWNALVKLASNHPGYTASDAFWRTDDTELGAVYTMMTKLRELLAPLRIIIPHAGRRGYLLTAKP
jgi:hypothetical protein